MMKTLKSFTFLIAVLFVTASFGQTESYKITNLKILNSGDLDYSPVPYRDGLMFTSTRKPGGLFACTDDVTGGSYSDLWFAQKNEVGGFSEPIMINKQINGKYHDGAATFNPEGTKMYFSRNNALGKNKNNVRDLKIYEANLEGNVWKNVKEAPFNNEDFATCHPTLSRDANYLFFASDRPGGLGGMDIWVSEWNGLGWGAPMNLGEEVNSSRNEIFPFIDEENRLFFASDGWGGFGGLDIFSATKTDGKWGKRIHLESPLNSNADDFGYSSLEGGDMGYFTSNRADGIGKDDIYSWEFLGVKPVLAKICVIDAEDETRISDADLHVNTLVNFDVENPRAGDLPQDMNLKKMQINGTEYFVFKADEVSNSVIPQTKAEKTASCDLEIPVSPEKTYKIAVSKPGYDPQKMDVKGSDILASPEYLIPISPAKKPRVLAGLVYNLKTGDELPLSEVAILNKCTGEKTKLMTNHRGKFQMEVDCSCDYEMVGAKDDFEPNEKRLMAYEISCDNDFTEVKIPLEQKFIPEPESEVVVEKPEFSVGQVIQLDKLYYDYNEYYIRNDAAIELDKVVDLLKKYPTMELELSSHTDARGSDSYNERLSSNRAKSAVQYIISRGIQNYRIIAKGYGETQLVNHCANGVKCTDEEHQANRRTEIKVTAFEEDGVEIRK